MNDSETASTAHDDTATGEPKWFNCQSCGKALSASEVVPIFLTGCCGFVAACRDCAGPTTNL